VKGLYTALAVASLVILSLLSNRIMYRASALSDDLIIFQLQTGKTNGANEEFVLLYNTSDVDVMINDWCIQYSAAKIIPAVENFNDIGCFEAPLQTELWLEAGGYASLARAEFIIANSGFMADTTLSGGSMAGTAGLLRLLTDEGVEKDRVGWRNTSTTTDYAETLPATVHSSGQVLSRTQSLVSDSDNNSVDFSSQLIMNPIVSGIYEIVIPVDVCTNIDGLQEVLPDGFMLDDTGDCHQDLCLNLDDLQVTIPQGYESLAAGECSTVPLENRVLFITELYPNSPSYDTGQEFIEIYNPHSETVNLAGYRLAVGPSFTKEFLFKDGAIVSGVYLTWKDAETDIVLPNTSGVSLRLISPAGTVVSETPIYNNAAEDTSWALVEDQWIFTNQITPSAANKPYMQSLLEEELGVTTVLAPCPAGKYRNPETNRCRSIETAVSLLAPCDEDEYRNPETNRCRKVAQNSAGLTPCDPGEERNPETNRCRKISVLSAKTESEIPQIQEAVVERQDGSLNWPTLSTVFVGTFGYMGYEWRRELSDFMRKFRLKK